MTTARDVWARDVHHHLLLARLCPWSEPLSQPGTVLSGGHTAPPGRELRTGTRKGWVGAEMSPLPSLLRPFSVCWGLCLIRSAEAQNWDFVVSGLECLAYGPGDEMSFLLPQLDCVWLPLPQDRKGMRGLLLGPWSLL